MVQSLGREGEWVCVTGRVVSGRRGPGEIPSESGEFLLYVEGNPVAALRGDTPEMNVRLDQATGPMVVCGTNQGIFQGLPFILVGELRGPVAPIGPEPGGWSAGEVAPGAPPLPSLLPAPLPPAWGPGVGAPVPRPGPVPHWRERPSETGEWGLGQPWWSGPPAERGWSGAGHGSDTIEWGGGSGADGRHRRHRSGAGGWHGHHWPHGSGSHGRPWSGHDWHRPHWCGDSGWSPLWHAPAGAGYRGWDWGCAPWAKGKQAGWAPHPMAWWGK